MEIRNVSKDKLRACIYGIHDNEINDISSCMRLAGESIDVIDIASLCTGNSATITLKQAELIIGIRKSFNFICDEYDFNDCTQLIISLGTLIGQNWMILLQGQLWEKMVIRDGNPVTLETRLLWSVLLLGLLPLCIMNLLKV